MTKVRADEDSPWKLLLRQYFREAIEFFFPAIAPLIDWTKAIEFLDTEFQKITPDAEIGKRFADQLVRVQIKKGNDLILLIHLEIQAAPEKTFPERMFIYAVRIFELFHQFPVSLAILCDGKEDWRPRRYNCVTPGSSLEFQFTAVKLLDYETQWKQLEQSRNPFAVVVMSHLKTRETKDRSQERKVWKVRLVKRLYELGYERSEVLNLFKFIDWVMILPERLKQSFWNELRTYEEERQVPYITSVEQIGYDRGLERGLEQGLERGERSLILRLLNRKFGALPDRTIDRINQLALPQLESLGEALLDFETIADLTTWLDRIG
ncbi:MAG: DUF4351 domain-containing protein [Synechococcales bacterium]|nr:DUF4351 domain-containing protein [Synechococcales bacterium]